MIKIYMRSTAIGEKKVYVCSNANPLHYYVLWVLRKADTWH